jgi:hypothetical protein
MGLFCELLLDFEFSKKTSFAREYFVQKSQASSSVAHNYSAFEPFCTPDGLNGKLRLSAFI